MAAAARRSARLVRVLRPQLRLLLLRVCFDPTYDRNLRFVGTPSRGGATAGAAAHIANASFVAAASGAVLNLLAQTSDKIVRSLSRELNIPSKTTEAKACVSSREDLRDARIGRRWGCGCAGVR